MRIIHNKILIPLKNTKNEFLLVNLLFGFVDILTSEEAELIKIWSNTIYFIPYGEKEIAFCNALKTRFYLMSEKKEISLRNQIIQKQYVPISQKLTYSQSASFIFSYDCNFCCPYCYEKERIDNNTIMTIDMIDAVLSLYEEGIKHVGLFGGEPLLPQHENLIKYLIKKVPNAYYTIITNGYYLDYFLPILSKIHLAMVQITLDGTKELHNKTRLSKSGEPTYDKIIDNIHKCVENKIPVKIRMNLSQYNIDDCYKARDELISLFGKDTLLYEMQPLFNYSYIKQTKFFNKMIQEDISSNTKNVLWHTLPPLSNFIFNKKPLRPVVKFCDSEEQNRFYDCFGNIYSCILSVGEANKSIGTFYPSLNLKCNSLLTYDITKNPICNKCNYALICGGGCPYRIMDDNGYINSTNCSNIKNEIENIIPLLYKQRYEA